MRNALQEIQKIRKTQEQHEKKIKDLDVKADKVLRESFHAQIISKGTLGSITWAFGCEEHEPNKLNVLPAVTGSEKSGFRSTREVNTAWGTNISRKEVIKLRDFLNKFLEWSGE